jgi:soluble lytic murein transglycosylase
VRRFFVALVVLAVPLAALALYVFHTKPTWYERARYPLQYGAIVRQEARAKDLDPALVAAVIYQESRFHRDARSRAGAIGLMQLQPETAQAIALRTGGTAFEVSDLTNPAINIRYGSWYLQNLFAKYRNERLVLAAYNAGQGNVDRWLASGQPIEYAETRAYVDAVASLKRIYSEAWRDELYRTG